MWLLSAFFHLIAFLVRTLLSCYIVALDLLEHRYWLLELICPVDYQAITKKQQLLKKKPQHLAVVLDSDDVSIPDLVNLLTWAMAFNILSITVYDLKGISKASKGTIQSALAANILKLFGHGAHHPVVHFEKSQLEILEAQSLQDMISSDSTPILSSTTVQDQHKYKQATTHITLTSVEDGMDCIIMCIKKLALAAQQGLIQPSQIQGYPFMNHALASSDGVVSDPPDFVMKFGNNIVQSGFLPWQTRYSEILYVFTSLLAIAGCFLAPSTTIPFQGLALTSGRQMGPLKYLSFQTFWSALQFYSDVNQRFGK